MTSMMVMHEFHFYLLCSFSLSFAYFLFPTLLTNICNIVCVNYKKKKHKNVDPHFIELAFMKIVLIYILIQTDSISTSQRFHYHNGIWINTAGGNEMRLITEHEEMKRKEKKTTKMCPWWVFVLFSILIFFFRFTHFLCQLKLIRAHEGWSWSLKKWIDSNFITI